MRSICEIRRDFSRRILAHGAGLNYSSHRRYARYIGRVEYPGVISQGHTKAEGHPCVTDLTPAECKILAQGGVVTKNDVIVSTHSLYTDGKLNVFLSFKDLSGNEVGHFAINEMVTCIVGLWKGHLNKEAGSALFEAHRLAAISGTGKIIN